MHDLNSSPVNFSLAVVIPCYNEASRLKIENFKALVQEPNVQLLFVNDGSSDSTQQLLEDFEQNGKNIHHLHLKENQGKGEAVRQGILHLLTHRKTDLIAFMDADCATPPSEILRLAQTLHSRPDLKLLMGSRVALWGRKIKRRWIRHFLGRVFATCTSLTLGVPIYDTQCGAKVFRSQPWLHSICKEPFISRWIFDVELIARIKKPSEELLDVTIHQIAEEPLFEWIELGGSKLRAKDFIRAGIDLLRIRTYLKK